jgi:hypothetical protein
MNVRFIPNWPEILRRAWSIRFIALAFVFTLAEVALQLLTPAALGLPSGLFAVLSGLASAAAFVSRLIAQKGVTKDEDRA